MELKTCEKEIDDLVDLYKNVAARQTSENHQLKKWNELFSPPQKESEHDDEQQQYARKNKMVNVEDELLDILSIDDRIQGLKALASKFRQRMKMIDPVTNAPRYGAKTLERVSVLLQKYDALESAMNTAHGRRIDQEEQEDNRDNFDTSIVQALKDAIRLKENATIEIKKKEEEDFRLKQAAEEHAHVEEEIRNEQMHLQNELRHQREREELAAKAETARKARIEREERMAEEERDAERSYLDSIHVGLDGVKQQLMVLKNSCKSPSELGTALESLHQLFHQITSRPEEIKFRRIRRDHPKFLHDIGRHDGGKEVLVAAGFTFEEIDGVKCYFTKEPDLMNDMDGWSKWFDLIKGTLSIIEEEMINTK